MTDRCRRSLFLLLLAMMGNLLQAQALTNSLPHVTGTRKLVVEQMEQVVIEFKDTCQILGQGSFLKQPPKDPKLGYADPLLNGSSDHDFRLVMESRAEEAAEKALKPGATLAERTAARSVARAAEEKAMQETWLKVRRRFIARITDRILANQGNLGPFLASYGLPAEEAAKLAKLPVEKVTSTVLNSINLYPPDQIVHMIVDDASAVARFKALGAVPSLGNAPVEGVWGAGKKATVQQLESFSRARLFYFDGKVVRAGFADLVHMAEGHGYYTRGGAANMAFQWLGKALEAIEHHDVRLLGKYLERVSDELKRVRAKGGLPPELALNTFVELEAYAKAAAGGVASTTGDPKLKVLLKELQFEVGLIHKLEQAGGQNERRVLTALLVPKTGSWTRLGNQLRESARRLPEWTTMECFIDGTILAVSAYLVPAIAGSESVEAAYRQAGVDLAFMAGLVPGFAALMTNLILEEAKTYGYALAVLGQDWENFMAGISQVKGFQGVTDAKGAERGLDGLALQMTARKQVESFVNLQAYNISCLNAEADAKTREGVKQELVKRFTPIVTARWQRRRDRLMDEALEALPELEERARQLSVRLDLSAERLLLDKGTAKVLATPMAPRPGAAALQTALATYQQRVALLGGAKRDKVFLTDTYRSRWYLDGAVVGDRTSSRLVDALQPMPLTLSGSGVHDLAFTLDLDVKVSTLGLDPEDVSQALPLFQRRFTQSVHGEVMVEGPRTDGLGLVTIGIDIMLEPSQEQLARKWKGTVLEKHAGGWDWPYIPASFSVGLDAQRRFAFSGPLRNEDANGLNGRPTMRRRGSFTCTGSVDLEAWTYHLEGTYTKSYAFGPDLRQMSQTETGSFAVDGPIMGRAGGDDFAFRSKHLKAGGSVTFSVTFGPQPKIVGGPLPEGTFAGTWPLTTRSGRDECRVTLGWKSPEARANPDVTAWEASEKKPWWDQLTQAAYQKARKAGLVAP